MFVLCVVSLILWLNRLRLTGSTWLPVWFCMLNRLNGRLRKLIRRFIVIILLVLTIWSIRLHRILIVLFILVYGRQRVKRRVGVWMKVDALCRRVAIRLSLANRPNLRRSVRDYRLPLRWKLVRVTLTVC